MLLRYIALALAFFTLFASDVSAVSPQVQLPQWYKSKISVTEWKPEHSSLTIRVELESTLSTITQISSVLHFPKSLNIPADRRERDYLNKGDKAVFMHRVTINPDFSGWIDVELRALPLKSALVAQSRIDNTRNPLTAELVEAEIEAISTPLFVGATIPLLVRDDIAISSTPELAFKPDFAFENHKFYLWYPPVATSSGAILEAMSMYRAALIEGHCSKAIHAARLLQKLLKSHDKPLELTGKNGAVFTIPVKVAHDILQACILTLQAIDSKDSVKLEKAARQMVPSLSRPFVYYNLANIYRIERDRDNNIKWLEKALEDYPAWAEAQSKLNSAKKSNR